MSYSTLLLDLDHTLLDSDASEAAAFTMTLEAAGASNPGGYFATYDRLNKALWSAAERGEISAEEIRVERFRQLIEESDLDADAQKMGDDFARGLAMSGDLYPGTREALDVLATRCSLALVTNGISDIQRTRVERLDLVQFFEVIIISSEIGVPKPHPGFFEETFRQLPTASLTSSLMIGDNLAADIGGARSYGIDTCWFNAKGKVAGPEDRPTFEISHISEVLTLV